MRQTTLTDLVRPRHHHGTGSASSQNTPSAVVDPSLEDIPQALVDLVMAEEQLCWHAVCPVGSTLKCIAELLLRCAPNTPIAVDVAGLTFIASDAASGRLIQIRLSAADLLQFRIHRGPTPFRCTLETSSLHAVFPPGFVRSFARDPVPISSSARTPWSSMPPLRVTSVPSSITVAVAPIPSTPANPGRPPGDPRLHTTIAVNPVMCVEYQIPQGYQTGGVPISSAILQRILCAPGEPVGLARRGSA